MAVYVDDMKQPFGRMIMCHMIADSDAELHAMADTIGVNRKWHQKPPKHDSHYDISLGMREKALRAGAIEITWRQTGAMVIRRRVMSILGSPHDAEQWLRDHIAMRNRKRKQGKKVDIVYRRQ